MVHKSNERSRAAEHIRVDYPNARFLSDTKAIKYRDAIEKYPDLYPLGNADLILAAYDFREAQLRHYRVDHTTQYANARSDISLGGYANEPIPEDILTLNFEKECVVCAERKKGINLCPECWQRIRKCLDLKGQQVREGWVGWGYEMNLDLRPLIEMLEAVQSKEALCHV